MEGVGMGVEQEGEGQGGLVGPESVEGIGMRADGDRWGGSEWLRWRRGGIEEGVVAELGGVAVARAEQVEVD